ncbi:MAG: hypothetical protein ABFD54_01200 [Armatimonadota bacterium]|nr:hypothetical protein [bacterium]
MTPRRQVVMAVTKMLSGMCTAGIALETGKWVRPVKEFTTVIRGDLTYTDKTIMRPFDIVDLPLIKPRPKLPHCEDWLCDFIGSRPTRVGVLEDRLDFLNKHSEPDAAGQILHAERSLALIGPTEVEAFFAQDSYTGKYNVRMRVPEMGERPVAVTDIKWRALGRQLLGSSESLILDSSAIRSRLGVERVFIALGLSRLHEGRHWPLVIGVHTWPDYEVNVDYDRL